MKILVVSSYLPYPLFSGGHIRLFNLIKRLSKNHEITLVSEKRSYQTEFDVKEVAKFCKKLVTVPRKKQWSIENIIKTEFSAKPFLITGHTGGEFRAKIREVLAKEAFDIIHVETSYVMQNIPSTSTPIVLTEHNAEYLVYKRYADNASFFLRPFLYVDVWKLKKAEQKFWKRAKKLVAVSESEKKLINADAVVPNGVDLQQFTVGSSQFTVKEKRVLFIGDFKWIQNRDSAEFILKEVWPKVSSDVKLWIVGKNIPEEIKSFAQDNKNIIIDENADDTAEIFAKTFALLAPIRVGGGTSYKILEAMASGVPVITTSLGIEGLDVVSNRDVLTAETGDDFAHCLKLLVDDEKKYRALSRNARKIIEEKYNWDVIVKELENVYESAVL